MRFQVPQFIEVEDKIFGPLTVGQFVYLAGGIGFLVAMWLVLPLFLAVLVGGPVALLGLALAFYKVNDRPFINVMQSAAEYFTKDKLYIWDKGKTQPIKEGLVSQIQDHDDPAKYVPATTSNKIKDLAWSLDIKESMYERKGDRS
ncbi:hypothetical protein COU15_02805 [Candidatus Kaiserbacteria bacterium CG10_big_fil_rev_8_21_14_0_10_45_20]|uniref:PrgI family protein n=1 Tax=Candidatus Kaiserbacteria bacterium CG10_big_fil_rev_8_21_14_0_10_45_20 TaxID=1974607 RepID=A0A2H0UF88_9BACT|nr:MAG: hypothetical protein COU15_02805 [Candidatus Kaiserbacteria bacterium CG10_big_fil_rev_8_21_14_0_10_45_20]